MVTAFVSHKSDDLDTAEDIASYLRGKGIDVWLDTWRIAPGDSIVQAVDRGLQASDVMVVLLSRRSVESKWVQKEWSAKFGDELKAGRNVIIPVCLESPKCIRIPPLLSDRRYIWLQDDDPDGRLLVLAAAILKSSMPVRLDLVRVFLLGFYAIQLANLSQAHKNTENYAIMERELGQVVEDLCLAGIGDWQSGYSLDSVGLFLEAVEQLGALAVAAYTLGYSDMSLINVIQRDDLPDAQQRDVIAKVLCQIEESLTLLSLHHWFVDYRQVVRDFLDGGDPHSSRHRIETFRPGMIRDLQSCVVGAS